MPFSIRPYRHFLKLPLAYFSGFWLPIALILLSSGPAYAEWVALDESDSATAVYVDRDTRLSKGKLVKMWVLYNFKQVHTVAGEPYFSNKVQDEYDCAQARHRTLVDIRFSSSMGFGNVVYNKSSQGKWAPVASESLDQILWKLACDKP